jgi:hypothetical protein
VLDELVRLFQASQQRSPRRATSSIPAALTVFRDGEWAERGEITLDTAAQIIGVAKMTALRMLRRGDLKGR